MSTFEYPRDEFLAPNDTLSGYDRWATSYDHETNPVLAATSWVLDHAPLGCADAEVVELGCGTGRNVGRVIGEGARSYVGVDGSYGMLNIAGGNVRDPRVSFIAADLLAPWKPTKHFDYGLVVLVLEHLPMLDVFFESLARAIRPGGRVRLVDLHPERIVTGSFAHFREGVTEVRFASVAHPVGAITAALDGAGFDVVRRDWLAADAIVGAVPSLAKHRGQKLLIDLKATRRR
ncbi:MAG: class I SAM-dependent methyltransferase [Deltaproteobacteria bacterium]|nr:class I SAM-dependent methyltransferase [Deltaproteobacteria bacterium]